MQVPYQDKQNLFCFDDAKPCGGKRWMVFYPASPKSVLDK